MRHLFKLLLLLGFLKLSHVECAFASPPNREILGLVRKYSKTQLVWLTRHTGVIHQCALSFSILCWAFVTSVGLVPSCNGYKSRSSRSSKTKEPLPDSSFLVVNDIIYATMGVTNTLTLFTPVTNIAYGHYMNTRLASVKSNFSNSKNYFSFS